MNMNDILEELLVTNYKFLAVAFAKTEQDREQILRLATACEKHGVSFKTFCDILGDAQNDKT